jgi:hypothetical protein
MPFGRLQGMSKRRTYEGDGQSRLPTLRVARSNLRAGFGSAAKPIRRHGALFVMPGDVRIIYRRIE